jgi:hypothetical protein
MPPCFKRSLSLSLTLVQIKSDVSIVGKLKELLLVMQKEFRDAQQRTVAGVINSLKVVVCVCVCVCVWVGVCLFLCLSLCVCVCVCTKVRSSFSPPSSIDAHSLPQESGIAFDDGLPARPAAPAQGAADNEVRKAWSCDPLSALSL